jgi:hypothetical protein
MFSELGIMEYEFIGDIAAELKVAGDDLQKTSDKLGIKTLQMAVPPYGVEVSSAVSHEDAVQLRDHYAETAG